MQMETVTRANGLMTKPTGVAPISTLTVPDTLASGSRINSMDTEQRLGAMVLSTKETI